MNPYRRIWRRQSAAGATGPGSAAGRRAQWSGGRATAGRAQTAGAPHFPEHNVTENRARHTGETAGFPVFPVVPDRRMSDRTYDPGHRPGHPERLFTATLPGVHVQQGHRFFLQTTRRYKPIHTDIHTYIHIIITFAL